MRDVDIGVAPLADTAFRRRRAARQALLKWASSQTIDHFASVWEQEFARATDRERECTRSARVS
jgi:hypothetical protein